MSASPTSSSSWVQARATAARLGARMVAGPCAPRPGNCTRAPVSCSTRALVLPPRPIKKGISCGGGEGCRGSQGDALVPKQQRAATHSCEVATSKCNAMLHGAQKSWKEQSVSSAELRAPLHLSACGRQSRRRLGGWAPTMPPPPHRRQNRRRRRYLSGRAPTPPFHLPPPRNDAAEPLGPARGRQWPPELGRSAPRLPAARS